jgi:hypothetical protein
VATLTVVELGKQAAVAAAGAAVAAVAGDGTGVTAHEGDGDQSDEQGETQSQNALHTKPPVEDNERLMRSLEPSRNKPDPGRPPDRSNDAINGMPLTWSMIQQPAALPEKNCGLGNICRLGNPGR